MAHPEEPFEVDEFSSIATEIQRPIQRSIHAEHLRQARIGFDVGLFIGAVGAILLLAGIGASSYMGFNAQKSLTVAAGIVMEIISLFVIKFQREISTRLEQIRRDQDAIDLVKQIQDPRKRDEAICELIKSLGKKAQKTMGRL
jgi:hypothetical protein